MTADSKFNDPSWLGQRSGAELLLLRVTQGRAAARAVNAELNRRSRTAHGDLEFLPRLETSRAPARRKSGRSRAA